MILKGRLSGAQRVKMRNLFDMHYKPSELAAEIGITTRQIYRVYIPLGCPSVRDRHRLFINGKEFSKWYEATYPKLSMLDDEAFCLTCKKSVKMKNPLKKKTGDLIYYVCKCPDCGRGISRIISLDKSR